MRFEDSLREHRALAAQHEQIRRAAQSAERVARLSDIAMRQRAIVQRAATLLAARGPAVSPVIEALRSDDDDARQFALAVLEHRKQFPRAYLDAAVEAAIRSRVERFFAVASEHIGATNVLHAMARAIDRGLITNATSGVFAYHVLAHAGEDVADVGTAHALLRQALWQAPDAEPGARRAGEPPPAMIVQLVRCSRPRACRARFERAIEACLGWGAKQANMLIDRTTAHPGAVALELDHEKAAALIVALRTAGVALRVVSAGGDLIRARRVVNEIRDMLGEGSDVASVRPDLDPYR